MSIFENTEIDRTQFDVFNELLMQLLYITRFINHKLHHNILPGKQKQ